MIDAWFPRCLDREHGGFACNFDRRWRPFGRGDRMLEFQARQTRTAARLAFFYPENGHLAEYALHGFRYLRDVMWDADGGGGWFWRTAADGSPGAGSTKHAHSIAYAVQACALVFRATGDPSALELAEEGFAWFDRHAYDDVHGGYHGWLRRDGSVIHSANETPPGAPPEDPLGHSVGLKDINVHGDWFEALMELREVTTEPAVHERYMEFAKLYLEHLTRGDGGNVYAFARDWTPQPGPEQYGYGFQAANRLWSALARGAAPEGFGERAEAVLLHTLRRASREAGFAFQGPHGQGRLRRHARRDQDRKWWVQVEALRALLLGWSAGGPRAAAFGRMFERQWRYIGRDVVDTEYGGFYDTVRADLGRIPGLPLRNAAYWLRKGDEWKDASHETDSLVTCLTVLRDGPAHS